MMPEGTAKAADHHAPSPRASLIAFERVTKRFGRVTANRDVTFSIAPSEVVALVGENGAGKSTVVNMIAGLLKPDEGRLLVDGTPVELGSPAESAGLSIGVVHQHFTLVPTLSVIDNIALAMPELGIGRLDRQALKKRIAEISDAIGFRIDPDARVDSLDVAHQQRVEILKALMREVRLLVLDEPTAVLGPDDKAQLFGMIARLKARGVAVILITHKLEDVFTACQRAIVMRDCAIVADRPVQELDAAAIIEHMIGTRDEALASEIRGGAVPGRGAVPPPGPIVGRLESVTLVRDNGSVAVADVSFNLHAGEILAVAGVDGNGQNELVRCLAGISQPAAGRVSLFETTSDDTSWTADSLRRLGVAHVPEDRQRSGIVKALDLAENYLLCHLHRTEFVRRGLVNRAMLNRIVLQRMKDFDVRAPGPQVPIAALSGGNQQKLVLARELDGKPPLILAGHPSRGLDVRTIHFVHERFRAARQGGQTVVLVSGDMDEIWQLADRIIVFAAGRAHGPVARSETTPAEIGAWIAGHDRGAS